MMEQITLDMIPNGYTPTAHISQYDEGRHIRFNLQNINLAGSETVTLKIRKTNGELVTKTIENHTSYVEYVSEKADCDYSGTANCEIVISKDGTVLGSKNFLMKVEADAYDGAGVVTETASGAIATFDTNMADVLQEVKCEINATGGNGTPDSPIPINGYTEANITRCGVNLFDKDGGNVINAYLSTKIEALAVARTIFTKCKPSTQYTISKTAGQRFIVAYTKELPDVGVNIYGVISDNTASSISITTGADAEYIVAMVYNSNVDSGTADEMLSSIQIAEGTDTTYHPYTGNTYTIAFGQTVYGGVLDVTRGKLHVTHGFYSGTWGDGGAEYAPDTMPDMKRRTFTVSPIAGDLVANNGKAKCNITDLFSMANNLNSPHFYVYDNLYLYAPRTLDDSTPVQCSYELATPFDIDITPVQVEQLLGKNNVYHNCNGNTEVKYLYNA